MRKSLEPITPRKKALILSSFKKVFETGNIEHLSKTAYSYIYLASGFIAHFNLFGFRDAYRNTSDLKRDVINNLDANLWKNFQPGEENYEYYMSKAEVFKGIYNLAKQH